MTQNTTTLKFAAAISAIATIGSIAGAAPAAAEYPEKPVTFLVGARPGGTTGTMARILGGFMEKELGQKVVVLNKPGGGGSVAGATLKKAAPDGYTLSFAWSVHYSFNPAFRGKSPISVGDFTYLGSIARPEFSLTSAPGRGWTTLEEMIAKFKKDDKAIRAGTPGPIGRMVFDGIRDKFGVKMKVVQTKGGAAVNKGILGGQLDLGWAGGSQIQFLKAGKMITVASAGDVRNSFAPNIPSLKEIGVNTTAKSLIMISGPKGLPENVTRKIFAALTKVSKNPEVVTLLKDRLNLVVDLRNPETTREYMMAEDKEYRQKLAKIRK